MASIDELSPEQRTRFRAHMWRHHSSVQRETDQARVDACLTIAEFVEADGQPELAKAIRARFLESA